MELTPAITIQDTPGTRRQAHLRPPPAVAAWRSGQRLSFLVAASETEDVAAGPPSPLPPHPFLSPLRTPSTLSLPFPFTLLKGASSDRQSSPPWKPINPRAFLVAATLFAAAPLIYFSLRRGLQKSGRVPLLARRTCGRGIATGPHYLMLQELHCPRVLYLLNDSRIKATCTVNSAT